MTPHEKIAAAQSRKDRAETAKRADLALLRSAQSADRRDDTSIHAIRLRIKQYDEQIETEAVCIAEAEKNLPDLATRVEKKAEASALAAQAAEAVQEEARALAALPDTLRSVGLLCLAYNNARSTQRSAASQVEAISAYYDIEVPAIDPPSDIDLASMTLFSTVGAIVRALADYGALDDVTIVKFMAAIDVEEPVRL
jgi:hypothetical protein